MSINALTSKDTDKGWANLYVNTLTAYSGLTVNGPTHFPRTGTLLIWWYAMLVV